MDTIQPHRATGQTEARSTVGDAPLLWATTLFAAAVLIHGADHTRRGADSLDSDVFWLGTTAIALEVAIVVLGCQRHRLAPLAAFAGGASLAMGYVVVHFLPDRSWLSDSFTGAVGVSALSWFAASLEVVAATTLGVVGFGVLRARGGLVSATQPNPAQRSLRDAVLHPVAVIMIVGNAALLVISLADRL